jgi:hypothetical protein
MSQRASFGNGDIRDRVHSFMRIRIIKARVLVNAGDFVMAFALP